MSAVTNVPAWMPTLPPDPPTSLNVTSEAGSLKEEAQTGYGQPMMSPEALRAMLERNMGHPLIPVNLGDK